MQAPMAMTIQSHSRVAVLRKLPPFSASAATLATAILDWGASATSSAPESGGAPVITQAQRDVLVAELLRRVQPGDE